MSKPTLLRLPPELRIQMVALVISGSHVHIGKHGFSPRKSSKNVTAIARVCRQLKAETTPMLLAIATVKLYAPFNPTTRPKNFFILPTWDDEASLKGLALLGPGAINYVAELNVDGKFCADIWNPAGYQHYRFSAAYFTLNFVKKEAKISGMTGVGGLLVGAYRSCPQALECVRYVEDQEKVLVEAMGNIRDYMSPQHVMKMLERRMAEGRCVELPLEEWYALTGQT